MCAVVGVFNNAESSKMAASCLFSMQHRGQETTGISASHDGLINTYKKKGLVSDVFFSKEETLEKTLQGDMAIGHNRYSTAGSKSLPDSQPIGATFELGQIAIAHNGNFINTQEIRCSLIKQGAIFQSQMDTENMIHLIARSQKEDLKDRIIEALEQIKGAYCMLILSPSKMYAIRDKYGVRPLSLGKLADGGFVVSSETCAFDLIGATYVRDVRPGEMIIFDKDSSEDFESIDLFESNYRPCAFEYIYFARPDSIIDGENVYRARENMGRTLAQETTQKHSEADIVVPIPDSGVSAAIGYSKESNIPFEMGILRNHYVGRTFIVPGQEARANKVRQKLSAMKPILEGKRVIVIDDSIVRGTTSKKIVEILFQAGAKEVHLKIACPPVKFPNFYGIDTPTKEELISSHKSDDEVCKYIGATSLEFLSIAGLEKSIGTKRNYALESFNGDYFI